MWKVNWEGLRYEVQNVLVKPIRSFTGDVTRKSDWFSCIFPGLHGHQFVGVMLSFCVCRVTMVRCGAWLSALMETLW